MRTLPKAEEEEGQKAEVAEEGQKTVDEENDQAKDAKDSLKSPPMKDRLRRKI